MSGPTPNGRLLDAARHIGTRNDSVGGRRKMQVYFVNEARAALDEGADFRAVDSQGRDAMHWLAQLDSVHAGAAAVAKLLIDRGYPVLDSGKIAIMPSPLLEQVALHLARKERQGKGVRSAAGDTFLHVACQDLPVMVRLSSGSKASLRSLLAPDALWLNLTNDAGETPAHVLWRPGTNAVGQGVAQWMWVLTSVMEGDGARLDTPLPGGEDVLDLVQRALDAGQVTFDADNFGAIEQEFFARFQQRQIAKATQGAQGERVRLRL